MGLAWKKKLSVGNAVIDSEHRNLLGIIDNIESLINTGDCLALSQVFGQLEQWLCIHFANENHIARSVNYDFTQHKLAQQNLLKEARRLKEGMATKDGLWPEDEIKHYSAFLKYQLIEHITKADMRMKSALQHLPYDFLPERGVHKCECGCSL
ncbi:bacteriohemerythrin [Candidatus Ferrigenium straubiae]|jgi:hemerythrin|uniref:bacteriohemerythrin n=1 Tax=Candidatus Ferrigenium straubiae TaxID=2919506 RepID=UPI003F4AD314